MTSIRHLRFHGRGGEGVKLASRIVSRAAFLRGLTVQDSPLYGAERRGAPVVAFVRLGDGPILERGYIVQPDVIVVMDDSLLGHADAGVLDGLTVSALLLVDSTHTAAALRAAHGIMALTLTLDVSSIALRLLGQHLLSTPVAAFTVKSAGLARWEELNEAVRVELADIGASEDTIARNLAAAREVFAVAPNADLLAPAPSVAPSPEPPFVVPHLPARVAAPSIAAHATSALRTTEGWRVFRPVITLARCTRCFLCFALCPEGAIHLDAEHYPLIDYAHCKGCLVCVNECPPRAIEQLREEPA